VSENKGSPYGELRKSFQLRIVKEAFMPKIGDHFRRGKLQVASSIIKEI